MAEYNLFKPKKNGSDLKIDYPELKEYKEFTGMSSQQVLFAYYHSCRASEHYTESGDQHKRVKNSLRDSNLELSPAELTAYERSDFDETMRLAMDRMERFRPTIRLQARLAQERMFSQLIRMVDQSETDMVSADVDTRKQIIDFIAKANEQLPDLVVAVESGWGITIETTESKKKTGRERKFMDEVMQHTD